MMADDELILDLLKEVRDDVKEIITDREAQRVEAAQELGKRPTRTELAMVLGTIASAVGILSVLGVF
jgi:hypothetical protein